MPFTIMKKIDESDSINGKAPLRQFTLAVFYLFVVIFLGYTLVREVITILFVAIPFGLESANKFDQWSYIPSVAVYSILFLIYCKHFYVTSEGNKVVATINTFFPAYLADGSTRFIIYWTGFALKWPWERVQIEGTEIEKEMFYDTPVFKITVAKTVLEVVLRIAWKPCMETLSTFLQNSKKEETEQVIQQISAKMRQILEVEASKSNDPEKVRGSQGEFSNLIQTAVENFAKSLGFTIVDVSFSKCDYDDDTQKRLNKIIETSVVDEIATNLRATGVSPERASELAAVMAGVNGVKIDRKIWELVSTPEIADAIKKAGPAAAALLTKVGIPGGKSGSNVPKKTP